jgi:hypothetical protein
MTPGVTVVCSPSHWNMTEGTEGLGARKAATGVASVLNEVSRPASVRWLTDGRGVNSRHSEHIICHELYHISCEISVETTVSHP